MHHLQPPISQAPSIFCIATIKFPLVSHANISFHPRVTLSRISNKLFVVCHSQICISFPSFRYCNKFAASVQACCQLNYGSSGEDPDEIGEVFFDAGEDGDVIVEYITDDEDDRESSVDLLIRFLQAMFKKLSKRAKQASRSILPAAICPQLASFAVDGVMLLASFSIVKTLL